MLTDSDNLLSFNPDEEINQNDPETEAGDIDMADDSIEPDASITPEPVAESPAEFEKEVEAVEEEMESEEQAPVAEDASESEIPPMVAGNQKWPGQWYVLHTYSGYEDAVSESLKQRINSLDMQDKIFDVLVPKENQIEIKNGKRKTVEKKMFPGYVLVNMNVTEDSWYVVRNTPNVTGFIGSGTVPVPIADSELKGIFKRMEIEEPKYKIDLSVGDLVNIKDGPFKNYDGSVSEVDDEKGKIKVLVSIFGRETPVELDFLQVKKV